MVRTTYSTIFYNYNMQKVAIVVIKQPCAVAAVDNLRCHFTDWGSLYYITRVFNELTDVKFNYLPIFLATFMEFVSIRVLILDV